MKIPTSKHQIFKIPAIFIGVFIFNTLLMTWGLYLRQSYSDYLLVLLASCFFISPTLFVFYFFYNNLKKLQEDKKHYWRFIIRNTKKSLAFYFTLCVVGHAIVEHLSGGLVLTGTITAVSIWLSTAVFIVLNRSLFKPYVHVLNRRIYIPENDKRIINSISGVSIIEINSTLGASMIGGICGNDVRNTPYEINYADDNYHMSGVSMMEINPASGAPMIGGIGGTDVYGNSYGTDNYHHDHFHNDNYSHHHDYHNNN